MLAFQLPYLYRPRREAVSEPGARAKHGKTKAATVSPSPAVACVVTGAACEEKAKVKFQQAKAAKVQKVYGRVSPMAKKGLKKSKKRAA